MNELQMYVYTCIISADNDEFNLSEEDKQEIMRRKDMDMSWDSILEPIKDDKIRDTLVGFFKHKD
jgi:putative alpha-1,2-mannosidase